MEKEQQFILMAIQYIGDFQNGLRNEILGIYYWSDGEKFEGEYKDNLRNGFGKVLFCRW